MYDKTQVLKALEEVKSFNQTTCSKVQHFTKLEEIRQLYYKCMDINDCLFYPDTRYHFCEYQSAIKGKATKKELDLKLHGCIFDIYHELTEILKVIDTMQWDEEKQKYIEIA